MDLEDEEAKERSETERSIQALIDEKAKILSERKQKLQGKVSTLGDNKEEQQKLIESHTKDTHRLINKMDAERLRVEADLQDRIRRKREAKRQAKGQEMTGELLRKRKQREEIERLELQKLAEEEKHRLEAIQKSMEEELAATEDEDKEEEEEGEEEEEEEEEGAEEDGGPLKFGLPLSEEQLTSVLLSTPLYHKLEQIRILLQNQPLGRPGLSEPAPEAYIDPKDAAWVHDAVLHPVDVTMIPVRAFIVYKFGCCVVNSLITHCNHKPVSLLLADKIPPNRQLTQNAFRNSFAYDSHNKIVYMRLERLESVGEFILVLVHTLSHIKVGRFSSDSDPCFVREFYNSLSVCCSELFFSRYRHSSILSPIAESGEGDGTRNPVKILESLFGSAHGVAEKLSIIDKVLDTRVMMGIDLNGAEFSHKNIMQRLARYSEFRIGTRLRAFLDNTEPNIQDHPSDPEVSDSLTSQAKPSSTHPPPQPQHLPPSAPPVSIEATQSLSFQHDGAQTATSNRRRRISRGTLNRPGQYKQFLQVQINDLQEKVDNLNEEYTQLVREQVETTTKVQKYEDDLSKKTKQLKGLEQGSSDYEVQRQALKDITTKLSAAKANLATSEIRVIACSKRLDAFKSQLQQKRSALQKHTGGESQ